MTKSHPTNTIPFPQLVDALLDNEKPFSPVYLHRFSDMSPEDIKKLNEIWLQIDTQRRVTLMEDLSDLNSHDTLVCFDDISKIALHDPDPKVRTEAIDLLWESDDEKLAPQFIDMMYKDPDEVVRAAAASALGMYVYQGELEEIPKALLKKVENALLDVFKQKDTPIVRRRCLESLGYSSRDEVPPLIEKAYQMEDEQWQASALFAMGRSADSQWEEHVLNRLDSRDEILFEAVRAAGELEIQAARTPMLNILEDFEELEEDLRDAIIWSLSKIGGEDVRETLEKIMDEVENEEEVDFIQNALDNLEFTEGANMFGLFDFEAKTEEDLDKIIDLDNDSDLDDEDDGFDFGSPSKN